MKRNSGKLRHKFFVQLLAVYVAGGCFPKIGRVLAEKTWSVPNEGPLIPQLLLGLIVLLSAYVYWSKHEKTLMSQQLLNSIVSVFVARLLLFVLAIPILATLSLLGSATSQIGLGLTLVLIMPTAFSAIAWSAKSNGESLVALTSVFGTTLLSGLGLVGFLCFYGQLQPKFGCVFTNPTAYTLYSLYLYFVFPGLLIGSFCGRSKFTAKMCPSVIRSTNGILILILNYINASSALPQIIKSPSLMPLIAGALSTLLLCFIGYVIAHRVARRLQASRATKIGSVYSAAMFNTGLAQVLVVLFFPNYQWILFPAFVLTFFQHFGAALFYSKLEHQDFQVRRI